MRFHSILLAALPLAACVPPYEVDRVDRVAVSGDQVLITGRTTLEGGGGCGGLVEGDAVVFTSSDGGTSFTRVVPEDTRPVRALRLLEGAFVALAGDSNGYRLATSIDGTTWTEVATGTEFATDAILDGDAAVLVHDGGVRRVPLDGSPATEGGDDLEGLYDATLTRVGSRLALASAAGVVATSSDGVAWERQRVDGLVSATRASSLGDRLLVDGLVEEGARVARALVAVGETSVERLDREDASVAMLATSTGVWLGDGTQLDAAAPLASARAGGHRFTAGATDGDRVILVDGATVRASVDGGVTFGAPTALPAFGE